MTRALRHRSNPGAVRGRAFGAVERRVIDEAGIAAAAREISAWPGYRPTPLRSLPGLARALGVGEIRLKDESDRFGLGSFKALGGAYGVARLLAGRRRPADLTVTTATDGNHGRSVAWGARRLGCRAVVFVHATVSPARVAAIEAFGAEVIRVAGTYDDSVAECRRVAEARGWEIVSDTSWPGYAAVPRDVMHGYTVMTGEILDQLPAGAPPTHVFVQVGVGGLAAAVFGPLWLRLGAARPRFVAVEPEAADCLWQSVEAGRPVAIAGELDTLMAGLAAGEVSELAWTLLARAVDDLLVVPDEAAVEAMRRLAAGGDGDPPLVVGEAGVGGLAGLMRAAGDPATRRALGLDGSSRVLLIASEGATDRDLYAELVGRPPEDVAPGPPGA